MMNQNRPLVAAVGIALIVLGIGGTVSAAPVRLISHVSATPGQAKAGKAVAMSLALADHDGKVSNAIVDMEIYDAHGKKVGQHFWQKQAFTTGHNATYKWSWKPSAPGTYTIKVGVFAASWKPLYFWDNAALALKVS